MLFPTFVSDNGTVFVRVNMSALTPLEFFFHQTGESEIAFGTHTERVGDFSEDFLRQVDAGLVQFDDNFNIIVKGVTLT